MKRKIKKILLITLLLFVLLIAVVAVLTFTQSKYSPIRVSYPSERMIKRSAEYTDVIKPLTADRFRKMLESDTSHYKIVVITSPYCYGCKLDMRDLYLPMYRNLDTSECKMYFIMDDCGSIVWEHDYFVNHGIAEGYFFRDDDPMFRENKFSWSFKIVEGNFSRLFNIINYATQPRRAFNDSEGVPYTLIINKEGKVKQMLKVYSDSVSIVTPYGLRVLEQEDNMSIQDLDFDKLDTVYANCEFPEELFEFLPKDTVFFRTYKPVPPKKHFCTPDGKCY